MTPLISVVMSVHNQSEYLAEATKSILNQSFENFELIIVNDGSTDETPQLLKKIKDRRVKVLTNLKKKGLAFSLNTAIKQSKGKYIARMDADDISLKDRLKTQLEYLDSHKDIDLCGSFVQLIDLNNKELAFKSFPLDYETIRRVILRFNPFIHPTIMLRAKVLKQIGNYDEALNGAEDYDLWLRIAAKHKVTNLKQVLLKYRINPQGISWENLKHTEVQALKARIKALSHYGYPWWQAIFLVKPTLSFFIPGIIKKKIFDIP